MKTLLRIPMLILLSILLFQCESKNEMDPYSGFNTYMSFKVDGVQKEYKGIANVVFSKQQLSDGPFSTVTVLMGTENPLNPESMYLTFIYYSDDFNFGDYTFPNNDEEIFCIANYGSDAENDQEGNFIGGKVIDNIVDQTNFEIEISSVSDTHVEGTFLAKLYNEETKKFATISDGIFKAILAEID